MAQWNGPKYAHVASDNDHIHLMQRMWLSINITYLRPVNIQLD